MTNLDDPNLNPYLPPASGLEGNLRVDGGPGYRLYSLQSIVLATFLGSLLAGGTLMALNFRRLGRTVAAVHSVVWTGLATAMVLGLALMLPDNVHVPNMVFIVPQLFAMYLVAKPLQEPAIQAHQRAGGLLASGWKAAGIALLVGLVVVAVLFGVLLGVEFLSPEELG